MSEGPWTKYGPQAEAVPEATTAPSGPWNLYKAPQGAQEATGAAAGAPWTRYGPSENQSNAETARLARQSNKGPDQSQAETKRLAKKEQQAYYSTPLGSTQKAVMDFSRGVGDAATFGYLDEGLAGISSYVNDSDYQQELARQRTIDAEAGDARGVGQVAGAIGMAMLPGGIIPGVLGNVNRGATIARGFGAGAVSGGLYGAGSSEAEGLRDLGGDVLQGAAFGGVAGGATGAVLKGVSKGVTAYKNIGATPAAVTSRIQVAPFSAKTADVVLKDLPEAASVIKAEGYDGATKVFQRITDEANAAMSAATSAKDKAAIASKYVADTNRVKSVVNSFDGLEGDALVAAKEQSSKWLSQRKSQLLKDALPSEEATGTLKVRQPEGGTKDVRASRPIIGTKNLRPDLVELMQKPEWFLFSKTEQQAIKDAARGGGDSNTKKVLMKLGLSESWFKGINTPIGLGVHALTFGPQTALIQAGFGLNTITKNKAAQRSMTDLAGSLRQGTSRDIPTLFSQSTLDSIASRTPQMNIETGRNISEGVSGMFSDAMAAREAQEAQLTEERRKAASGG